MELQGGFLDKVTPLAVTADEANSLWIESLALPTATTKKKNIVILSGKRPRSLDTLDLTLRITENARLAVSLKNEAMPKSSLAIFDIAKLFTLAAGQTLQHPLDNLGSVLHVSLTPGTRMALQFDRDRMLYEPGEKVNLSIYPHLLTSQIDKNREYEVQAELYSCGLKERKKVWSETKDFSPLNPQKVGYSPTLPDQEGVYELVLTLISNRSFRDAAMSGSLSTTKSLTQRKIQLLALGSAFAGAAGATEAQRGQSPLSGLAFSKLSLPGFGGSDTSQENVANTEPATKKLDALPPLGQDLNKPIFTINSQDRAWWNNITSTWSDVRRLNFRGKPKEADSGNLTQIEHPLGKMTQLPKNGSSQLGDTQKSWQLYTLPIEAPCEPHILEIVYPSDVEQAMDVVVNCPSREGVTGTIGRSAGFENYREDFATQKAPKLLTHRVPFWPEGETANVMLINKRSDRPALYESVRVYRASEPKYKVALPPSADRRQALAYLDRPIFPENFDSHERRDPVQESAFFDDWNTFYQGGSRMVERLSQRGYNGLVLGVFVDGSTIYPSQHLLPTTRWDTGAFFSTGQDPMKKDVLEMLFRMFDRKELTLIPMLDFSTPLPALEAALRRGGEEATGINWIGSDGETLLAKEGTSDGRAPYYNLLNPTVQQAIFEVVQEVIERYGHHPAFGGIALRLSGDGYTLLPGPQWGVDDKTCQAFVTQMRIGNLPDDEEKFLRRATILASENGLLYDAWMQKNKAERSNAKNRSVTRGQGASWRNGVGQTTQATAKQGETPVTTNAIRFGDLQEGTSHRANQRLSLSNAISAGGNANLPNGRTPAALQSKESKSTTLSLRTESTQTSPYESAQQPHSGNSTGSSSRSAFQLLATPEQSQKIYRSWLAWRSAVLAEFYGKIADAATQANPNARLLLVGADTFSPENLGPMVNTKVNSRQNLADILQRLGIDPRLYTEKKNVVLFGPQFSNSKRNGDCKAEQVALNRLISKDDWFASLELPGNLHYNKPKQLKLDGAHFQDKKIPEDLKKMWFVSQTSLPSAIDSSGLTYSLDTLDSRLSLEGGWMLPVASNRKNIAKLFSFRVLPNTPLEEVKHAKIGEDTQPVHFYYTSQGDYSFLCVVNNSPIEAKGKIELTRLPTTVPILDAFGKPLPASLVQRRPDATTLTFALAPHDLQTVILPTKNILPASPGAIYDTQVNEEIGSRIAQLEKWYNQLATISNSPEKGWLTFTNFDFEKKTSSSSTGETTAIPGWIAELGEKGVVKQYSDHPVLRQKSSASAVGGAPQPEKPDYSAAVLLASRLGTASLTSSAVPAPKSGRVMISVWLKPSEESLQPPLRIAIQANHNGKPCYRFASLGKHPNIASQPLASGWKQYHCLIDNLPQEGLQDFRIRFELLGSGIVMIDDVKVAYAKFTPAELSTFAAVISDANALLRESKVREVMQILDGYWAYYLQRVVTQKQSGIAATPKPLPAVRVASRPVPAPVAPTPKPAPKPKEKEPEGVVDQLKGWMNDLID